MRPETVYIDDRKRFAIGYIEGTELMFAPVDQWEGVERGMTLRIVSTLEVLDEKISILEAGLDDIVIEHIKFFLAHVINPDLRDRYPDLRFLKRVYVPEWVDDVNRGALIFSVPIDTQGTMMQITLSMSIYYEHALMCSIDPRMAILPDMASRVDNEWMQRIMLTDPGMNLTYYRHYPVEDSSFVISAATIRKTDTTPTLRLYGLTDTRTGIVYAPPFFTDIQKAPKDCFIVNLSGSAYVLNDYGGMFDLFQRHLPPMPVVDTEDYFRKATEWIFSDLKKYYRDTDILVDASTDYPVGTVLRAGFFLDTTENAGRPSPTTKTRFLILSSHAVPLYEINEVSENNPETLLWKVNAIHYNAFFIVTDIARHDDVFQVTLLQLPPSAAYILDKDTPNHINPREFVARVNARYGLKKLSRDDFTDYLTQHDVHPMSLNPVWQEKVRRLIGKDSNGKPQSLDMMPTPNEEIADFEDLLLEHKNFNTDVDITYSLETRKPLNDDN